MRIRLKRTVIKRSAILSRFAVVVLALVASAAHAQSYLPAGALSYDETRLDNGMRIVTQRVHGAPYISARLVTETGTDLFPCEQRELPHLVEHLLFSANSEYAESEIDDHFNAWGGAINAYTYGEQTDVVMEVHSRFQADAMPMLATLVANFRPDAEGVAREAKVVERESGISQSQMRLWWSRQPVNWTAGTKFSVAAGAACPDGIAPVRQLTANDVQHAFDTYYVASNMILVLVGDLTDEGIAAAREAFSALPKKPRPEKHPRLVTMPKQTEFRSGWLSGTANQRAPTALGVMPMRDWQGYYALLLLESWLNDRMFRELRSERGVAYTPVAQLDIHGTAMSFMLATKTEDGDAAFTRQYLQALTDEVRTKGISEKDFNDLREATLLGLAQSFERISDRADYIAGSVREIEAGGLFRMDAFYENLDYATFNALIKRDWPQRFVVIDDSPRITWAMRAWLLGGSVLLLCIGIIWRILAHRRARRLNAASPIY